MVKSRQKAELNLIQRLIEKNFLFRGMEEGWLEEYLSPSLLKEEKLFSNRPIYTAFRPDEFIDGLYLTLDEGLVIMRSAPLDRIIAITYPGGCFGLHSLRFSFGLAVQGFPSLVEAYKTTHVLKIPVETIQRLYEESELFRQRYYLLFELRQKFQYHLLNCSTYPPQAVASLLRALIYQERELGNQPNVQGIYEFDLPIDVIARACQLNQRTVEQVLKGMHKVGLLTPPKNAEASTDLLCIVDPEGLKEVYSATRDKVSWWPLR
ncbi:putative transcriptional regulator, Crp/Fnr family [Rippkaea orientalis PCC 8801]|uniref:Putative transcriptional regulator, Crp/Fnr family n=1 Tax=Rippkaea orientalis (strain PCC 8801 / RF-1) TaxID=41431 RepID=B7K5L9_RIPO1|nr:Crp/Fnr family transcriptional regulator [Rippkaea orientalis]ACK66752.1 putative transcriptional regulator, Crp/Fnr family [Rippkaea orientalis PCC 8801]